jgi:pyridoxine kinase
MATQPGAVLCISSQVARGGVGNRAMVFALERLGFTVIAVPAVFLPYHPGHGPGTRIATDDKAFDALLQDLVRGGRAADIAGIVSGYLASEAQAHAVARVVRAVKSARRDALYLCDPVIGDAGRVYVSDALAAAIRDELLPLADAATPNAFECAWLAGQADSKNIDLVVLAKNLAAPTVLVTSAPALMRGQIGNLLVTETETVLFEHPELVTRVKGTGDLLAALLIARRLQGRDWRRAAEMALSSVFEIVAGTAKAGVDELLLAELQTSLLHPHAPINVRRLHPGSTLSSSYGTAGRRIDFP